MRRGLDRSTCNPGSAMQRRGSARFYISQVGLVVRPRLRCGTNE
jgi:hypothetical protein